MAAVTPDYYIRSGASGDDSGSSMANGDVDISTANTAGLSDDDQVFVASDHSKTYGGSTAITLPGNIDFYSVKESDETYEEGAEEISTLAGNHDLTINSSVGGEFISFSGFNLRSGDDLSLIGENRSAIINGGSLGNERTASGSASVYASLDSGYLELFDTKLRFGNVGQSCLVSRGGMLRFNGVSALAGHVKINRLFNQAGGGGINVDVLNSDLDSLLATGAALFNAPTAGNDYIFARFDRCKLPSNLVEFVTTPTAIFNYEISYTSCSTGDGYHYFKFLNSRGIAEEDTVQYMTTSEAKYDGTNRFSAQIDTGSFCNAGKPFRYKIATFAAQDLTTDQTVSMEIAGPSGATDTDIWMELVVNDNDNEALGVRQTTRNADIVGAGTALTSSSAVWQTTTDTEYTLSKAIGALTNVDNGNVDVYICSSLASASFNADLPTIAAP